MNSNERAFAVFLTIVAAISVALTLTLFVFVTTSFWKGFLLTFLTCSAFGLAIALGLRQHRTRKVLPPLNVPAHENFPERALCIPLQETQGKFERQGREILWVGVGTVLVLNLMSVVMFTYPRYLLWWLVIVNGICAFIGAIVIHDPTRKKAVRLLALPSERYLRVDAQGLTIPIEIVSEPALHVAVESNQTEVSIAWPEITHWEVSDGMSRSPAQHSLSLTSSAIGGAFGRFGLIRTPEILRQEQALLDYARQHLSHPIVWAASEPPTP